MNEPINLTVNVLSLTLTLSLPWTAREAARGRQPAYQHQHPPALALDPWQQVQLPGPAPAFDQVSFTLLMSRQLRHLGHAQRG